MKKLIILSIVLAIILSSCNKNPSQMEDNSSNDQSISQGEIQSVLIESVDPDEAENLGVLPTEESEVIIPYLLLTEWGESDGWRLYDGHVVFYNSGTESIYKTVNGAYSDLPVLIETKDGNRYEGEVEYLGADSYKDILGLHGSYFFPPKLFLQDTQPAWFEPFNFHISFKIPSTLTTSRVTIQEAFLLDNGNTEPIIIDKFMSTFTELFNQYPSVSEYSTGTLPVSLTLDNGIVWDIQPDIKYVEVEEKGMSFHQFYCLTSLVVCQISILG